MGKRISSRSDNSQDDFDEFDDPSEHLWEEEEEEEEDGEEDEDDGADEDSGPDVTKFTQSDFDRAVSKARKSARSAATKKLLEDLGVLTPDEAKTLLQTAREVAEGKGKDDDQSAAEAAKLKVELAQVKAEALKRETTGRVKDALVEAGISVKAAGKVRGLVELDSDNPSDDEIADAIVELQETMPQLFSTMSDNDDDEEEEDETQNRQRRGTTPPKPKRKRKGSNASEQAREILARRHPQTTSKT